MFLVLRLAGPPRAKAPFVPPARISCRRRLLKPVVLVTGGSRGIGAATAWLAAQQGWAVAVNYTQDAAAAQSVVTRIQAAGGLALSVQADVGNEAQVLAMFAHIDQALPAWGARWAGLVNSAGVVDQAQRVEAMSVQRLERMMRTNVIGSIVCAREAIRRMSTQHGGQGGTIVNLSSVAARLGGAGQYVDYAASKGAIESFTIGLARELAADGIRVNAVRPGIIDTEIHASGGQPRRAHELAPQIPMQRPGTAEEVAQAIVWLLGEQSSYSTGGIIEATGGR
jgi:NAD(P)-dependent dehydrogenase (short-subunit alcohol dehydrogenase family)